MNSADTKNGDGKIFLSPNSIYVGDARIALDWIAPESLALSVWSPPYYVGKS
jgi:hypothetical protein